MVYYSLVLMRIIPLFACRVHMQQYISGLRYEVMPPVIGLVTVDAGL